MTGSILCPSDMYLIALDLAPQKALKNHEHVIFNPSSIGVKYLPELYNYDR